MLMGGLVLSTGMALAQTAVTGKVTSADDGSPVVGASIKVVGTNWRTIVCRSYLTCNSSLRESHSC